MELGRGKITALLNDQIFSIVQCKTLTLSCFFNESFRHSIMRDTATARRSTIGDLKKSLSARKSVIAEALGNVGKTVL